VIFKEKPVAAVLSEESLMKPQRQKQRCPASSVIVTWAACGVSSCDSLLSAKWKPWMAPFRSSTKDIHTTRCWVSSWAVWGGAPFQMSQTIRSWLSERVSDKLSQIVGGQILHDVTITLQHLQWPFYRLLQTSRDSISHA